MSGSLHRWYGLPDLDRFAEREVELSGELKVEQFSRLRDMLHGDAGSVHVRMRFAPGGPGWLCINLDYRTTLQLVCQRCLEPMSFALSAEVDLGLIESEAIELPASVEPIVLENGRLQPAQLIEDELIVALPLVPKHETVEECGRLAHPLHDDSSAGTLTRDGY